MNNFTVEIDRNTDGTYQDYTSKCVFPLKIANFLDEQLDECELEIKHVPEEYFRPLTIVKITLRNTPDAIYLNRDIVYARRVNNDVNIVHDGATGKITETIEKKYIVASDNSIENKALKKGDIRIYDHKLYLIEGTKIAEGFIGDPLTFTNSLGNNYITHEPTTVTANAGTIQYVSNTVATHAVGRKSADFISSEPLYRNYTVFYKNTAARVFSVAGNGNNFVITLVFPYPSDLYNETDGVVTGEINVSWMSREHTMFGARISPRGMGSNNNGVITAQWNTNIAISVGATISYMNETATVLHYDSSTHVIGISYSANSVFAGISTGTTIAVLVTP